MSGLKTNRRMFLKVSGMAVAAAAAAGCGTTATPTPAPATVAPTQAAAAATAAPTVAATTAATTAPTVAATTAAATAAPTAAATSAGGAAQPTKYNEAPILADMVKAGTLPPVDQRLPKNPLVVTPLENVGKYSGVFTWCNTSEGYINSRYGADPLVFYGPDSVTIEPNVAESWDISTDGLEYTFHLREGVRWSDGEPFNADDVMFWYEDTLLNTDLTPNFPVWLSPGGQPAVVTKIDDYTIKFTFVAPYAFFLDQLFFNGSDITGTPKHYLQQFHTKYADKATLDAAVKAGGFNQWFELFGAKWDGGTNPDLPLLHPWILQNKDWSATGVGINKRNPYYFKVDTDGNQLPYFDELHILVAQSADLIPLHIVSGEVDDASFKLGFANYTLYVENADKGNYTVGKWDYGTSTTSMHVNQTKLGNDEMANLLRDVNFRTALSMGINRDDFNELLYLGEAGDVLGLYPESVGKDPAFQKLVQFNVDEANTILDSLGLDKKNADGVRLLPSGNPINFDILGETDYAQHNDAAALVLNYWKELGLTGAVNALAPDQWQQAWNASEYDIEAYEVDYTNNNAHWLTYPRAYFPIEQDTYWAPLWGWWYDTKGKNGVEPTNADVKKLQDMWQQVVTAPTLEARKALEDEAFRICAMNLWPVPTCGGRPEPHIQKKDFHNVPEYAVLAWAVYGPRPSKQEQFYRE